MAKLKTDSTVQRIFDAWEEHSDWVEEHKPWSAKGWREHLGGSVIGRECSRQIWYGWRWVMAVHFPGRVKRLFDTGHREEPRLIADLEKVGATVYAEDPATGEQFGFEAFGGHFGGSQDALILGIVEAPKAWHLGEFKTSKKKAFRKLQREGVRSAKPAHFDQMQCYMGEWNHQVANATKRLNDEGIQAVELSDLIRLKIGRIDRALYLARNKNDDDLHQERIPFEPKRWEAIRRRAWNILKAPAPPDRITDDPTFYKCKWCDFSSLCHKNQNGTFPAANCRTCIHSTPNLEGEGAQWMCEAGGFAEPIGGPLEQFQGCGDHLFIPDLVNASNPQADPDRAPPNFITYDLEDGRKLCNFTATGMKWFRQYAAQVELENGLSAEEAEAHLASQQFAATSFELAERPITITEGGAWVRPDPEQCDHKYRHSTYIQDSSPPAEHWACDECGATGVY